MNNIHLFVTVVILISYNGVYSQLSPAVQQLVNTMQSMRDTTQDPCNDFFQYACGTFIKNNPIPPSVTTPELILPTIFGIMDGNDAMLAKLVQDPWPIINDFYQSCMSPTDILALNFENNFRELVYQIEKIDVTNYPDLFALLTEQIAHSTPAFFEAQASVDNYQQVTLSLVPAGNTLQPNQYSNPTLYQELLDSIATAFELFESPAEAQADASLVGQIEKYIAASINTADPENVSVSDISQILDTDFGRFLEEVGVVSYDESIVLVSNISYFLHFPSIVSTFGATAVQRFIQWQVYQTLNFFNVTSCIGTTNPPFICQVIMEDSPYSPPWDQAAICRNLVHLVMEDYVGLIFSYEIVTNDVYEGIRNMTTGIQKAFATSLPTLSWLDKSSMANVDFKLANVIQIIGHPNVMEKYDNVTTDPEDFYKNIFKLMEVDQIDFLHTQSSPFNRSDFEFDPMIVNAFYSPQTNTINFPAGILESPMFSGSWPKLFQYGRLGYVVGHENTHGFDNQGSLWNAYGLPGDLFDSDTRTNFNNNAECIVNFYSNYTAFNTTKVNGKQTLGENIADIGGVKNSFRAYQAYVLQYGIEFKDYTLLPDLTTDQAHFLFLGQTWCSNENLQYAEFQYQNDVHSPARYRVNGPLSQFDQFAATFNCPANAPMNPSSRCDLW